MSAEPDVRAASQACAEASGGAEGETLGAAGARLEAGADSVLRALEALEAVADEVADEV